MPDLSSDISAAVDKAAAGTPAPTSSTPASPPPASPAKPSPSTPAAAPVTLPGAPAVPAGTAGQAPKPRSTGAPTTEASGPSASAETPSGEPPRERWDAILENARSKAAAEARQAFAQALGVAPDVEPNRLAPHIQALLRDPVAYYQALGTSLARAGALRAEPEHPAIEPPRPDVRAEDGTMVYSAQAMEQLLNYQALQLRDYFEQKMTGELQPLQEMHAQVQQHQMRVQAHEAASADLSEAEQWADFQKYRPQIAEMMAADRRVTLWSAYNKLHQSDLKSRDQQLTEQARQSVLSELQHAPVSRDVKPGTSTPSTTHKRGRGSFERDLDAAVTHAISTVGSR